MPRLSFFNYQKNLLFALISCISIAGIFLLADLPTQSQLRILNLRSLAHIPLYGILTIFLILTFRTRKTNEPDRKNPPRSINLLLPCFIALTVAILDEIHQISVPGRDASIIDVLLDATGTGLTILIYIYWLRRAQRVIQ